MRNFIFFITMLTKPEKIIKRIIKATGQRQSVLLIGSWQEELIQGIKEKENSTQPLTSIGQVSDSLDNTFTRIITDYSLIDNIDLFYKEVRRLLLPTGMLIISANCALNVFEKLTNFLKKDSALPPKTAALIKPKLLQDQIHDNGFLIDGYYGYPGGHILMMAQIQNKEVTTLFTSEQQETVKL